MGQAWVADIRARTVPPTPDLQNPNPPEAKREADFLARFNLEGPLSSPSNSPHAENSPSSPTTPREDTSGDHKTPRPARPTEGSSPEKHGVSSPDTSQKSTAQRNFRSGSKNRTYEIRAGESLEDRYNRWTREDEQWEAGWRPSDESTDEEREEPNSLPERTLLSGTAKAKPPAKKLPTAGINSPPPGPVTGAGDVDKKHLSRASSESSSGLMDLDHDLERVWGGRRSQTGPKPSQDQGEVKRPSSDYDADVGSVKGSRSSLASSEPNSGLTGLESDSGRAGGGSHLKTVPTSQQVQGEVTAPNWTPMTSSDRIGKQVDQQGNGTSLAASARASSLHSIRLETGSLRRLRVERPRQHIKEWDPDGPISRRVERREQTHGPIPRIRVCAVRAATLFRPVQEEPLPPTEDILQLFDLTPRDLSNTEAPARGPPTIATIRSDSVRTRLPQALTTLGLVGLMTTLAMMVFLIVVEMATRALAFMEATLMGLTLSLACALSLVGWLQVSGTRLQGAIRTWRKLCALVWVTAAFTALPTSRSRKFSKDEDLVVRTVTSEVTRHWSEAPTPEVLASRAYTSWKGKVLDSSHFLDPAVEAQVMDSQCNAVGVASSIYAKWTCRGLSAHALVDTGASINLIHESFLRRVARAPHDRPMQFRDTSLRVSVANGNRWQLDKSVTLRFSLGEHEFESNFYVAAKLSEDVLLGIPALRACQASVQLALDPKTETDWLHLRECHSRVPLSCHPGGVSSAQLALRTKNHLVLPPGHHTRVHLQVQNDRAFLWPRGQEVTGLVEPALVDGYHRAIPDDRLGRVRDEQIQLVLSNPTKREVNFSAVTRGCTRLYLAPYHQAEPE